MFAKPQGEKSGRYQLGPLSFKRINKDSYDFWREEQSQMFPRWCNETSEVFFQSYVLKNILSGFDYLSNKVIILHWFKMT